MNWDYKIDPPDREPGDYEEDGAVMSGYSDYDSLFYSLQTAVYSGELAYRRREGGSQYYSKPRACPHCRRDTEHQAAGRENAAIEICLDCGTEH